MTINYFVSKENIPNDGSKEVLEVFSKHVDFGDTEIYIYPDIHYKKGARVVNGMLMKSSKYIYPACCGVENCGFTFGKIKNTDENTLKQSFKNYSKILKPYQSMCRLFKNDVLKLFLEYLQKDFEQYPDFYLFLNLKNIQEITKLAKKCLSKKLLIQAASSVGSLGGGNHFFEIHKVVETNSVNIKENDFYFILHSDSIAIGDKINLRYSNLSELDFLKNTEGGKKRIIKERTEQFLYFLMNGLLILNPKETVKLLYSQNDYRTISFNSPLGRRMMFEHNLAKLFGEMNRDMIIKKWAEINNLDIEIIASHNHDSLTYENGFIFHRNGVQYLGNDEIFILPSAMGNYSYLMKNLKNEKAFLSANHGTGRNQDKHIARECYKEDDTINDLENENILFCHIGKGNIAEQNYKAFKDVDIVLNEMEKNNLGKKIAKLKPIAIMKG